MARDQGSIPAVKLAELDSGVHHLREQADMDRRATAARLIEERNHRDRMDQAIAETAGQLGRVVDLVNRLDVSTAKHAGQLDDIRMELASQRGAIKVVAVIAAAVPLVVEVIKHIVR